MLKSIEKIKGLGVYKNYSKPAGMQDFGIKNLIYGWNYSGKTTLSRIFSQLETKVANPDLADCEFTFNAVGETINERNFSRTGISVRVFNSDFVRDNLHFDGRSFNPILILGKESEEAQRKIDTLSERIKRSNELQIKLENKLEEIKARSAQAKTDAAKLIRQHLKIDPYTATHLGQDLTTVSALDFQLLGAKELADAIELALTPDSNKPSTVEELSVVPMIEDIHKEAVIILAATPSLSNTIKHLEENPVIERWIQQGLSLHTGNEVCDFCGNNISLDRLEAFRMHFSKDLADHKERIDTLLKRVKMANISLGWPKAAELNSQFRSAYISAIEILPSAIDSFNNAIGRLIDEVQGKADEPHKIMVPSTLPDGLEVAINNAVSNINAVIKKNNELASNFESAKAKASKQARYHYVRQFAEEQAATGIEQQKTQLANRSIRIKNYIAKLQPEIDRLQAQISQAQKGKEKINERLTSMLGSEAVQIQVVKDSAGHDRFQLIRSTGVIAKNMSDGERTAVALSYFMTKLQEISPAVFKETIIYIDDPISSLDSNHIFQVTAAIRALFFKQQERNAQWETTCKQLFISTHNFEFFNLLREIKPITSQAGARLYLIRRIAEKSSVLEEMPSSLARYQSEYQFLFEVIHRFHKAPDKTDHEVLMLLPNAMRRFIELYTYSRLPGPKNTQMVDERAETLFGVERAKRILKIFHYFSHGNTLDRLAGNNELIFDLEHAVADLIYAIAETDKPHLDSLIAAAST